MSRRRILPLLAHNRTAFLWLLAAATAPCVLGAQQGPTVQQEIEVYESARLAFDTALAERNALRAVQEDLIDQRNLAVQQRDNERADQLSAEIQEKAEELDQADAELRRLEEAWVRAGEELIVRINADLLTVANELEEWTPDAEEGDRYQQLEAQFDSLTSLRDSVDAEIPRVPLEVPVMPNVERLPGDGPAARDRKANIYRDYVEICVRRIEKVDQRIGELESARDFEEIKAGFERSRAGFGRVPLGPAGGGQVQAAGDTVTDLRTFDQRIEELEELKAQLESAMAEAQAREQELRRPPGGSG